MVITKNYDFGLLSQAFENDRMSKKKRALENPVVHLTPKERLESYLLEGRVLDVTNVKPSERGGGVKNTKHLIPNPGSSLRPLADEGYLSAVVFSPASKSTASLETYLTRVLEFTKEEVDELIKERFSDMKRSVKKSTGLRKAKAVEKPAEAAPPAKEVKPKKTKAKKAKGKAKKGKKGK